MRVAAAAVVAAGEGNGPAPHSQSTGRRQKHTTASGSREAASAASADSTSATPAAAATPPSSEPRYVSFTVSPSEANQPLAAWLKSHAPNVIESRVEALCLSRMVQRAPINAANTANPMQRKQLHHWHKMQAGEEVLVRSWLVKGGPPAQTTETAPADKHKPVATAKKQKHKPSTILPARCTMSLHQKADLLERVVFEDADFLIFNKPTSMLLDAPANSSATSKERYLKGMLWVMEEFAAKKQWFAEESARALAENRPPSVSPTALAEDDDQHHTEAKLPRVGPYQIVSKLDPELSGIVLIAKHPRAATILTELLQSQFKATPPEYSPAIWSSPSENSPAVDAQASAAPSTSEPAPVQPFLQIRYLAICHGKPAQQEGTIISQPSPGAAMESSSFLVILRSEPPVEDATHTPYAYLQLLPHSNAKHLLRRHCYQVGLPILGEQLHEILIDRSGKKKPQEEDIDPMDLANAQYMLSVRERAVYIHLRLHPLRPLPLFLHANELVLHHPELNSGEPLTKAVERPRKFQQLVAVLEAGATAGRKA